MLRSKVLVLALGLIVLPLALAQAAPPPPCTCELCLEDPGVKCNQHENGSCVHLLRSGVCLGQLAELVTVQVISLTEPVPVCGEVESTPAPEEPVVSELVPQDHDQG